MDYDDFELAINTTTPKTATEPSYVIEDIVFAIFAVFALTANSLIIYTTYHFTKLRTTAPYSYIANWGIADLCSLVLLPIGFRAFLFIHPVFLSYEMECILSGTRDALHGGTYNFVTLLASDWVLAAYFPVLSNSFRKHYKKSLAVIWTTILTIAFIGTYFCMGHRRNYKIPTNYMLISLTSAFVVVLLIHMLRLVQKLRRKSTDDSSLLINLATAVLVCWAIPISLHGVMHAYYFFYAVPVVNFVLLYWFNEDYLACIRHVVTCRCVTYKEVAGVRSNVNSNNVDIDFDGFGSGGEVGNPKLITGR